MLNMIKWSDIKKWFKLKGFKKVSDQSDDKEYKVLFLKGEKAVKVVKRKRAKDIYLTWFNWTNMTETDKIYNETCRLEESPCVHRPVVILEETA